MSGAQITVFTKLPAANDPSGSLLSKRILLVDGRVVSDGSSCRMALGNAEVVHTRTASGLAHVIAGMRSQNALALGSIKGHAKAQVVSAHELARAEAHTSPDGVPIIARSRDYIDYPGGPAWMLFDFDKKGMPLPVSAAISEAGGVWPALLSIMPGLAQAARVTRASTSAGLKRTDTGDAILGSGGEHHYILVADGSDIDRALTTLHELCWLRGYGWHLIGSAGQILDRAIIDSSVRFGERLVFEGPPAILPPLAQDAAARAPVAREGLAIDTRTVIPDLTDYQLAQVREAKRRARLALEPRAAEIRAEADRRLAEQIGKRTGMPFVAAIRAVAARRNGTLLPHIVLDFDHLGFVTVEDVLAAPNRFIDETLADPLEGADYGRGKAMVLRSKTDPRQIFISSFAHGRAFYQLRHDARTAKAALAAADPQYVVDVLCALVAQAEIEADELVELIAAVAAKAKTGVRAIQARLKTERIRRDEAARRVAHDHAIARDGRLRAPLPPPDGERTPIIRLIDETLAADRSEEPPMRDAVGNIVEVRTVEPWGLHLLTATGSNADVWLEDQELRAPPEPTIAHLTPVGVELLIERHICFETEPTASTLGHAAALQRPFIDALMEMSAAESSMPVGRAINTAPLVAINGNIIAGVGLDRSTGLIHRIEPQLHACLPAATPTAQDVREALRWLLDEWLVDVKADMASKLLVLMLGLSMIERVLLKDRPAWFVTAGHRGGGKTTLVLMVTGAIFGRMAAAAAWSDNEEERRKALFSYLRQGVATLCWDNIPRGAQIASASIEKALTSPEVSDRVLGESEFEAAPAGTVQIFTGNNIAAKGDMCSRSFRIVINVDRPDPENRTFVHPDPLGWTVQHRLQILKCLYMILIYGCRNRPAGQLAKTRFKDWWLLCGWPVELAASLIDESIDCIALLQASDGNDDETTAASTMLSVLRAEFGNKPFKAKDISTIIKAGAQSFGIPEDDLATGKAQGLLDAFGEMLGRRLDRPTAGTIGKLLKNRLVDRPTFIDGSNVVATLKRFSDENTGLYSVLVSPPNGGNFTTAHPAAAKAKSPISRISPQSVKANGREGHAGDRGDIFCSPLLAGSEEADDIPGVPAGGEAIV